MQFFAIKVYIYLNIYLKNYVLSLGKPILHFEL